MRAIALTTSIRIAIRRLLCTATVAVAFVLPAQPAAADLVRTEQWQLTSLDARGAWKLSTGAGVIVAVLDSGVDATHPDLVGQVLPGVDFVDPKSDGRHDPVGHGTTVAALIAGRSDDSAGVIGLAPDAKILPVRVLDRENKYDDPAVVASGVRWAVDHGASVLNLSLGGAVRSEAIAEALRYAAAHDVVVVACTGNVATDESIHQVWYPAREPGVVAVAGLVGSATATGHPTTPFPGGRAGSGGVGGGGLWSGSLTGPETVLTAPAVNLTGAKPGGGYWVVQGTSFAAPLVAATAALIRAKYPRLDAANVVNRLIDTARDLGPTGRDNRFGYGEVAPLAALRTVVPEVQSNPLTAPSAKLMPSLAPNTQPSEHRNEPLPAGSQPRAIAGADGTGVNRRPATDGRLDTSLALGGLVALVLLAGGAATLLHRRRRRPL